MRAERTNIQIPVELAKKLGRECRAVSPYCRSVIEAADWALTRARARVASAGLTREELVATATLAARPELLPLAEACALVLEHEAMGRGEP